MSRETDGAMSLPEPDFRLASILESIVANALPTTPGSVLVLTLPPAFDVKDAAMVERVQSIIWEIKIQYAVENVIALQHGFSLQSFSAEDLARLGLQKIPPKDIPIGDDVT